MTDQLPDTIYLQYYGSDWHVDNWMEDPEPAEGDEVTWCVDKINEVDIKYLLATPQREAAPDMFEALEEIAAELGAKYLTDDAMVNIRHAAEAALELAGGSDD